MHRRLAAAAVLLLALSAQGAPKLAVPDLQLEKYTLPNGLQVVLHVDKKRPVVHVNLWYHVGSKNEAKGRSGFAHLFEHLMLQGAVHAKEDYFSLFARLGARGGRDSNGTTNTDRTSYFSTAPSSSLETMLWVHSDLLATLPEAITQAKLDNQREVVRNERRESYDNAPYGRLEELLYPALFPPGHPYSWTVLGSHEDLEAATLADVKAFFRTYYTPSNLSLVIAGDFQPAEARRLVEKYFGSIPPGPPLARPARLPVRLDGEKVIEVADRVPQERVFVAWPAPAIGAAGEAELALAASVLGDGISSRLQKALIYDGKLCSTVSVDMDGMELAGAFTIDAMVRPGASSAEVQAIIDREIGRLAKQGPTPAELARAKVGLLTAFTSSLEDVGSLFGGQGDTLNYYNTFYGDPGRYKQELERRWAISPADVRAAVARVIDNHDRVIIHFRPATAERGATAELDRAQRPAPGPESTFQPPEVQRDKLPSGLEIIVVERHDLPVVNAALVSRAGAVRDPAGKEGLARLVAAAMTRGTKSRPALAVQTAFADLGTALATDVQREYVSQTVRVLTPNLGPALDLLAEVATSPAFAEGEVDRERKLQAAAVEEAENDADLLADRLLAAAMFGPAHPYGRPILGNRATVAALGRADVAAFHAAAWKPDGAALVLVGDIDLARARALAQAAFGRWSGSMAPAPAIGPPAPPARGKLIIVDRPDAAQTVIAQILAAPPARGDDYFGWRLASQIYGMNAAGRLYLNLRQNKGYTYGVRARTVELSSALGWYTLGAFQSDKTKESVVELVAEEKGIAGARPFTAAEATEYGRAVVRGYAADFATSANIGLRIAEVWSRGWPLTFFGEELRGIGAATVSDAQAAAKRYAVPAETTLLLVGDRRKIEAGLRELKLGEMVFWDAEGNPVPAAR